MEEETEGGCILVLPEGCISETLSLTSPLDACRSAAVSKDFKVAADSDAVWERFLPPDYTRVIARAVSPVAFTSKKQLYFTLSDSHILLDDGYLSFKVDKLSGKKCYMLGARALSIAWQDDAQYWEWGPIPESRFPEVAILRHVFWLHIQGQIASVMLSPKTTYAAYLVFQITGNSWGFNMPGRTVVSFGGIETESPPNVYLKNPETRRTPRHVAIQENAKFPSERSDGWKEIELGEFYCDEGDDAQVQMAFKEIWHLHSKGGLIVQGIELRPR